MVNKTIIVLSGGMFFFFFLTEGYPNRQLLKANQATKRLKVKSLIVTGFNYSFKLFKK